VFSGTVSFFSLLHAAPPFYFLKNLCHFYMEISVMKLRATMAAEFKNLSLIPIQLSEMNHEGQMIAPGGSTCSTLGCSSSCSCGAISQ
jgi:hypothetical protein